MVEGVSSRMFIGIEAWLPGYGPSRSLTNVPGVVMQRHHISEMRFTGSRPDTTRQQQQAGKQWRVYDRMNVPTGPLRVKML